MPQFLFYQASSFMCLTYIKKQVSGDYSSKEILKSLKAKNVNKIILGHLNINSVRNKLTVRHIIGNNIDSETYHW